MIVSPLLLTGCFIFGGGDDETADTGAVDCEVNEDINGRPAAGPASGPVGADGLAVAISAQFRLDDNGEVASFDSVDAQGNLISGIVLRVRPTADAPEQACTVIIPITPDTTTVTSNAGSAVWTAEVAAFLSDIDSNCGDPAYQTIIDYAGGDVATAFDDISTITLGPASAEAIALLTSIEGGAVEPFVIGGSIQLGADDPVTDMAVLADTTDECGLLDDTSERIRANRVLNNGPVNGVYRYNGVGGLVLTFQPG